MEVGGGRGLPSRYLHIKIELDFGNVINMLSEKYRGSERVDIWLE